MGGFGPNGLDTFLFFLLFVFTFKDAMKSLPDSSMYHHVCTDRFLLSSSLSYALIVGPIVVYMFKRICHLKGGGVVHFA